MTETRFRQAFLLLLVAAITAVFVAMIRAFLVTILLAAIFAGLGYPLYEWTSAESAVARRSPRSRRSCWRWSSSWRPSWECWELAPMRLCGSPRPSRRVLFFGAMGFILGPILAALFVTAWQLFGTRFRTALAETGLPEP